MSQRGNRRFDDSELVHRGPAPTHFHVGQEVRAVEPRSDSTFARHWGPEAAEEFVHHLRPWARRNALGVAA